MKRLFHLIFAVALLWSNTTQSSSLSRVPNTTLTMPQNPAVYGYALTNAFGTLTFSNPIMVATPPGETNRIFIIERWAKIIVITNLANPTKTTFLDLTPKVTTGCEEGLLGLAFHPNYASNGLFYIFYTTTTNTTDGSGLHDRLSQYHVSANPNQADATSEVPLITQYDEACNHNAGCLNFGLDGYLYVSLGDEGDQMDSHHNSQRIDKDFFSAIMRLDVDKKPGNLTPHAHPALMGKTNYFVPADNPFVGATTFNGSNVVTSAVREEFWAVGLRNPWRFSIDPETGTIWEGDVGQDVMEEINVIAKGGNYGWNWREGNLAGPVAGNQGPTNFSYIHPIVSYYHGSTTNQGNATSAGVVYHGDRIGQLNGRFVFGDYASGNIWALTPNGTNEVAYDFLFNGGQGICSFGVDPANDDVLTINLSSGIISRLIYSSALISGTPLPANLSGTGAFANLTTLTPNAGIVPYDVNVSFWSDNAKKSRWFSLPNTNQTFGFSPTNNWSFPTNTIWIKHFDLEMTNGVASSAKRLETRLLVKNSNGVYGVTYRWGGSTTDAAVVPEGGMDESFVINDGGTLRTQVWHYPSRTECLVCHAAIAGHALGFNTAQLHRDQDYGGGTIENQIHALNRTGYFNANVTNQNALPLLANATNTAFSTEYRVRSYLAANCSQCHQPGGAAGATYDARIVNPLSASGIVNGHLANNFGDTNNLVIVPNDVAHSVILQRIATNGSTHMPPLASNLLDTNDINLVRSWVTNGLVNYKTFAQWQQTNFGSTNAASTGKFEDYDGDGSVNFLEYLVGTDPKSAASAWKISARPQTNTVQITYPQIANRGFLVEYTTNIGATAVWQPLDLPANRPFISASNQTTTISDTLTNTPKFYRVRVYEP